MRDSITTTKSAGDKITHGWRNNIQDALGMGFPVEGPSYIMFIDGANYKVRNGTDGTIDFTGANAGTVFQSATDIMASGGLFFIKRGTYPIGIRTLNNSFIRVTGENVGATVLQGTINLNAPDTNTRRNVIENLTMDGTGTVAKGIVSENTVGKVPAHAVRNVGLEDYTNTALSFILSEDNHVDSLVIERCAKGIYNEDVWGTNLFHNIGVYNSSFIGIHLKNCLAQLSNIIIAGGAEVGTVSMYLDGIRGKIGPMWIEQPSSTTYSIDIPTSAWCLKFEGCNIMNLGGGTKPAVRIQGTCENVDFDTCFFEAGTPNTAFAVQWDASGRGSFRNTNIYNYLKTWKNGAGGAAVTYDLPDDFHYKKMRFRTFFESIDGFLESDGGTGGSATLSIDGYVSLQSHVTTGDWVRFRLRKEPAPVELLIDWTKRLSVETTVQFMQNAAQTIYLGVGYADDNSFVGFKIVNNAIYGCTRNGVAESVTASLGTFNASDYKCLRAELQPGINALFYIANAYAGVLATNLPVAGATGNIVYALVTTNENVNKEVRLFEWGTYQYDWTLV